MSVQRWRIVDPHDSHSSTNTYVFPMNPAEMSSPYRERSVSATATVRGRVLLFEGGSAGKQWTFGGPILDKDHFEALRTWVYKRPGRVIITDHYSRKIECVLTALEVTPKRRTGHYYSHDYTVTALITSISDPTVPNNGPL